MILDKFGQVPTSADVLLQINADPKSFSLSYLDWDPEKENFVELLAQAFANHIIEMRKRCKHIRLHRKCNEALGDVSPKYAKEIKCQPNGKKN